MFDSNERRNLNAKVKRNLRVGPIVCKSYGETSKLYQEEEIPKATLIWRAVKLPIYSVALVPLTVCVSSVFPPSIFHYMLLKYSIFHMPQVGASAAYLETGLVLVKRYVTLMLSSVLIITWLNLR